jgi:predicted dehydrogenase
MGGFIDNEVAGSPAHIPPYSHGAGFFACERTDLVACSDLRPDVMAAFGRQYDVPVERQYLDYRALIEKERPDIVSVATQPEPRAEIVVYAANHGVRAIYAEKAMAASLADADAMVEAVERNGVHFNLGTLRRWSTGFDAMKQVIDSGEMGALKSIVVYANGTLFNTASHTLDLVLRLNSDQPAAWVQAHLPNGDALIDGAVLRDDPTGHGIVQFHNGVTAYALLTPRSSEYEAICERGTLTSFNNGLEWQLRRSAPIDPQGRRGLVLGTFPHAEPQSRTLRLIEDLVHALDTGQPSRGGVRVARASTELIFAFIESHRRGGGRVALPLEAPAIRLQRTRAARQPTLAA